MQTSSGARGTTTGRLSLFHSSSTGWSAITNNTSNTMGNTTPSMESPNPVIPSHGRSEVLAIDRSPKRMPTPASGVAMQNKQHVRMLKEPRKIEQIPSPLPAGLTGDADRCTGVDEQGCIFGRDLCCIDAPGGATRGAKGRGKMLDCMPQARANPAAIPENVNPRHRAVNMARRDTRPLSS